MAQRKKKRSSSSSQGRRKKKGFSLVNLLVNFFITLMLIVGLILVFNDQIKNFIVQYLSDKNRVENVTPKDIAKNLEKKASFDFDAVESLDFETVVRAQLYQDQMYVVGGIAIPDVELNLPIFKGLSNYAISVGAGTMKEEQVMGSGNYALASHHMIQQNLLFGPLVNLSIGQVIYLTDLTNIYEYTVTFHEYVDPNRSELIEDVDGKKMVTLVTCDNTGNLRLVVQAELKQSVPTEEATKAMKKAFNLKKNTY